MGGVAKKSKLKQALSKIFHFSTWKIVLVLILMCFVAATLLRIDHIRMTELKQAVMDADASNDDEAIAKSLSELQSAEGDDPFGWIARGPDFSFTDRRPIAAGIHL